MDSTVRGSWCGRSLFQLASSLTGWGRVRGCWLEALLLMHRMAIPGGAVEKLGGFCDLASEVSKCDWSYHFLVKQTAVGQGRFKTHGKVESLQQRLYGIQIVNPSLSSFSQKMFAKRCYIDPPIKHLC